MIKSYRSKALRLLSEKGDASKIPANMAKKIINVLHIIDNINHPSDLIKSPLKYHALTEKMKGRHSIYITGNWRVTFGWDGDGAFDVDLEDYH
jgi:proteic killer suppression protein